MIEARSCERFRLLSIHVSDAELREFYHDFLVSEAGHYRMITESSIIVHHILPKCIDCYTESAATAETTGKTAVYGKSEPSRCNSA
jgi:tRNA isopentenyl-2-thiomethyl-A-37 hydroxylase MiaE